MSETIYKLQPDRALELGFFNHPSSNAALHSTAADRWTLSGTFRSQHDYAIVEWNKYNRWDHPRLAYLPDGDLSGIVLSYDEERTGCQPLESAAYAYTDWPDLLIWSTPEGGGESLHRVPIKEHAALVAGQELAAAGAAFTLAGTPAAGDAITLRVLEEKYAVIAGAQETAETLAARIGQAVNDGPAERRCDAAVSGASVTLTARNAGLDGNAIAFQVLFWHLATQATGELTYSGSISETGSTASATINGRNYSANAALPDTLDDLTYRLAVAIQADPEVDAAWSAEGITLVARQAGAAGNTIELAAAGDGGVAGTVARAMSGGSDEGPATSVSASPERGMLAGGSSAARWRVQLDFSSLLDTNDDPVPVTNVRRLRWTYSPPLTAPESVGGSAVFVPAEFSVTATNWYVSGVGTQLFVAGPRSHRLATGSSPAAFSLTGAWNRQTGNVFDEALYYTVQPGAAVEIRYQHAYLHDLYLGTQRTFDSAIVRVTVDAGIARDLNLFTPGQFPNDLVPARELLAAGLASGEHLVRLEHTGTADPSSTGQFFYLGFLEAAVTDGVPGAPESLTGVGLATDYDTAALWLSPERLAWSLDKLGLKGELNHFAGTEYFYEKEPVSGDAAQASVTVGAGIQPGEWLNVLIADDLVRIAAGFGDTPETLAGALAMCMNTRTSVWAQAAGDTVEIRARVPGSAGNSIPIAAYMDSGSAGQLTASGPYLSGGTQVVWSVASSAPLILNRAARDWHRGLAAALLARGVPARLAFSLEVKHAPIEWAQRFYDGTAVLTGNGCVQTSPSIPAARDFWRRCYTEAAGLMVTAGAAPRLQFGEVQWWYFADGSPPSMAYYDAATTQAFESAHGRPLVVFTAPSDDPSVNGYADAAFLRDVLGDFCQDIRLTVAGVYSEAEFEVLWPRDVNDPAGNQLNYFVNLPAGEWIPANITAFKTEAFQESWPQGDMNKALVTIRLPYSALAYQRGQTRHLLGVMPLYAWERELQTARSEEISLVTLWAWDHFCSVGREIPLPVPQRSSRYIGN